MIMIAQMTSKAPVKDKKPKAPAKEDDEMGSKRKKEKRNKFRINIEVRLGFTC